MPQRAIWRLAVVSAVALVSAMLTGGPAAASVTSQAVRIATVDQGKLMTAHSYYSNVYLISGYGSPSQQWALNPTGAPDTYLVANAGDGQCMRHGTGEVGRGSCGDAASQWRLIYHANGSVSFKNIASGLCVDVLSPTYSMWLWAKTCNGNVSTQQYRIL